MTLKNRYTTSEVRDILGYKHSDSIRMLIHRGNAFPDKIGRDWFFTRSEIKRLALKGYLTDNADQELLIKIVQG